MGTGGNENFLTSLSLLSCHRRAYSTPSSKYLSLLILRQHSTVPSSTPFFSSLTLDLNWKFHISAVTRLASAKLGVLFLFLRPPQSLSFLPYTSCNLLLLPLRALVTRENVKTSLRHALSNPCPHHERACPEQHQGQTMPTGAHGPERVKKKKKKSLLCLSSVIPLPSSHIFDCPHCYAAFH